MQDICLTEEMAKLYENTRKRHMEFNQFFVDL